MLINTTVLGTDTKADIYTLSTILHQGDWNEHRRINYEKIYKMYMLFVCVEREKKIVLM